MGTGYTRNDTSNNIADGNVIDAADLDGEFDSIQAAFNASTGHTHDGTSAEGAPITVTGPAQEYVSTATELRAKTNNTYDLGSSGVQWKNAYVAGNITVGGTVDGRDIATDGSKLDGIEAGADVTDTANVTAAGALMDSELTNITAVKALNQGVATTDSPSFAAATVNGNITVTGTVDGRDIAADGSKLDGIESGATADQTASEILTAIKTVDGAASGLDADLLDGQQGTYYLDANNFTNMPAGYTGWTVSDGTNSESVGDGSSVTFSGSGATSVSYDTGTNTVTISSTDNNTTYSAGTGLSLSGTTFTNTAPDQTVSLTGSGATTVTGTYPNFTISSTDTDTNTTYSAGSGLTLSGTTFSHTDTSSQGSVSNGGDTVIQSVTLDTYGHVTGLSSTTISVPSSPNNATITLSAGTGLTGGGSFTTNQSFNETITFNSSVSDRGIAKAWVNFNGTGTIAARDSENVSSLTDNGNGDFTITFSSAMAAADYSAKIDHNGNGSLNGSWMAHSLFSSAHSTTVTPTASAYRFCTFHPGNLVNQDCTYNTSSAHGDLA